MTKHRTIHIVVYVATCLGMLSRGMVHHGYTEDVQPLTPPGRIQEIDAMVKASGEEAVPKIVSVLKDADRNVRCAAAQALKNLSRSETIPALREALKDDYYPIQIPAAQALGNLGDKESVPRLIELLKSSHVDVRIAAAQSLGKLGDKSAIGPVSTLVDDQVSWVREAAAIALGDLNDNACIAGLVKALGDGNRYVQRAAAEALAKIGDNSVLPAMHKAFLNYSHKTVCEKILEVLPKFENVDAAFPTIVLGLQDEWPDVRRWADEAVPKVKVSDAAAIVLKAVQNNSTNLVALVRSDDVAVRLKAIEAAGIAKENLAIPGLVQALKDGDANVRLAAAGALPLIPAQDAFTGLLEGLKSDDEKVRNTASADLLKMIEEAKITTVPLLIEAANCSNSAIRRAAIAALGRTGSNGEVPVLIKTLKDSDVSAAAAEALSELTSLGFGTDDGKWSSWWEKNAAALEASSSAKLVEGYERQVMTLEKEGELSLPYGIPFSLAVDGNRVCVANGFGGMDIVDVSDPSNVRLIMRYVFGQKSYAMRDKGKYEISDAGVQRWIDTRGEIRRVCVKGNYAYVMTHANSWWHGGYDNAFLANQGSLNMVYVLDISDPSNPRMQGGCHVGGMGRIWAKDLVLEGDRLLATFGPYGLRMFDVSNAKRPKMVARRGRWYKDDKREQEPCEYNKLTVIGKYAYVSHETNGLHVVDVTMPPNSGSFDYLHPPEPPLVALTRVEGKTESVCVSGNRAFICGDYGLKSVDITGYREGTVVTNGGPAVLSVTGGTALAGGSGKAVASGNYVYVANEKTGVQIIDISNPDEPKPAGTYSECCPVDILASENRVYVADKNVGLRILDVSDVAAPRLAGSYLTSGEGSGLELRENYAYVADAAAGLKIVDLSAAGTPKLVSSLRTPGSAREVFLKDNYAYIADDTAGLTIVNISNVNDPKLVGNARLHGEARGETTPEEWGVAWDVHVQGNYAYLATFYGLIIVDVSNPAEPKQVSGHETPKGVFGLWVEGKYAYVLDHRWGMYVVDVSNPLQPKEVALCEYADTGRMRGFKVKVVGHIAYIADQERGLVTVDVSNPAKPVFLGRCNTGHGSDVSVWGKYAYIADRGYGLRAIDISDPQNPRLAGSYHARDLNINGVEARGDYAYLADAGALRVIKIGEKTQTLTTAYKFDAQGRDVPLKKPDGSRIKPEEVESLYGKVKGFTIVSKGIDICSRKYAGGRIEGQLKPVYQDLSDAKGWPAIRVTPGTVAIDPFLGRFKFADGDDDQMKFAAGVKFIWGGGNGISYLRGNYLYFVNSEGTEFFVMDVSHPDKPKVVSTINTGGFPYSCGLTKNHAYISNGQWVAIVDISDVHNLKYVGRIELGSIGHVLAWKEYVFVEKDDHLKIFDAEADSVHPKLLGEFVVGKEGIGDRNYIFVENTLYIGFPKNEYWVVDMSNVESPKIVGKHKYADPQVDDDKKKDAQGGIEVIGKTLYISMIGKLQIVDVADGANPKVLGVCILPEVKMDGPHPMDVTVWGEYAYLAGGQKIFVVQVSDPSSPKIVGEYHAELNEEVMVGESVELDPYYSRQGSMKVIQDRYVYLTAYEFGVWIMDMQDPTAPKLVATQSTSWNAKARAVDVSDPLHPKLTGAFPTYAGQWGWFQRNDRVYRPTSRGLLIIDLSNHDRAKLVGHYKVGFYNSWPYELDDYMYVFPRDTLIILDIHDPANLSLAGKVRANRPGDPNLDSYGTKIYVTDGYAYIIARAGHGWSFQIVDISDRRHPSLRGMLLMTGGSSMWCGVHVVGDYAYLAYGTDGMVVLDISDKDFPYIVNVTTTTDSAQDIEVRGKYAYLDDYFGGIHVFDVSDPRKPVLVDRYSEEISNKEWGDKYLCSPAYQGLGIFGDYAHIHEEFYYGWHVIDMPHSPEAPEAEIMVKANW